MSAPPAMPAVPVHHPPRHQQQPNPHKMNAMPPQQQQQQPQQSQQGPPEIITEDGFVPDPPLHLTLPTDPKKKNMKRKFLRIAGTMSWEDDSLAEWDPSKWIHVTGMHGQNAGISFQGNLRFEGKYLRFGGKYLRFWGEISAILREIFVIWREIFVIWREIFGGKYLRFGGKYLWFGGKYLQFGGEIYHLDGYFCLFHAKFSEILQQQKKNSVMQGLLGFFCGKGHHCFHFDRHLENELKKKKGVLTLFA